MKTQTNRKWIVLVLLAATVTWLDAPAEESPPEFSKSPLMKFLEQDYLLGTWGGRRTQLAERGADFEFFYIGSMPSIVSGGRKIEKAYQGLFAMTLDLDSKKLVGYEGGHLHISSLWLHGEKPFSDAFIGDLNKVNLIDYPNSLRLWELWYEHKFAGTNVSIKAGILSVDQDFIRPEYSSIFVNQTFFFPTIVFDVFDIPVYPKGRHGLPSSPLSSPGIRLRYDPTPNCFVQGAVYDGNPDMSSSGTRINLNNQEGALIYAESGYKWNHAEDATGLPGNMKIGGWYHTDDFYDNYNTILSFIGASSAETHSGNYGVYATVDQSFYRELDSKVPAMQGLGAFARGGWSPKDRNLVEWALDGGVVYKGLIPTRDYDSLGLAAAWMWMSDDIARAQKDVNSTLGFPFFTPVDYEGVVELTYKAQVTAWWTLQPSVQWVAHPGGSKADRDAWAVILMTTLRF
jgi:porin